MSDLLLCEEDKLDPRARKCVFVGFKKGVKSYKFEIQGIKNLSWAENVTFDETSLVKPTNSQQVESRQPTKYYSR